MIRETRHMTRVGADRDGALTGYLKSKSSNPASFELLLKYFIVTLIVMVLYKQMSRENSIIYSLHQIIMQCFPLTRL